MCRSLNAVIVIFLAAEYRPSSTTPAPLAGRHKSPRDRAAPYNPRPRYTILSAAVSRVSSTAAVRPTSLLLLLLPPLVAASSAWHVTSSAGSLLST